VAERLAALQPFLEKHAAAVHPVTRQIIEGGAKFSAADVFRAWYRLEALRRNAERLFETLDILAVPTSPTIYRVDEVLADPIRLNSNLGLYTNFVNLLDLAALAVPNAFLPVGLPAGLTLIGPPFSDEALARLGWAFQQDAAQPLGATGAMLRALPFPEDGGLGAAANANRMSLAVVGAHMSGLALNPQLRGLGGRFEQAARTAPVYRLHALPGDPPRPGLVRVEQGGVSIECEVWSLDAAALGNLLATAPAPLAIGTVQLADGSSVKGFVCEAVGAAGTPDISALGGWRAFIA
jgi:allophanate hydrolase